MRSISGRDDYKIIIKISFVMSVCLLVCLFGNLLCPQISSDFDQAWYGAQNLEREIEFVSGTNRIIISGFMQPSWILAYYSIDLLEFLKLR
jgi:hypothetical protein